MRARRRPGGAGEGRRCKTVWIAKAKKLLARLSWETRHCRRRFQGRRCRHPQSKRKTRKGRTDESMPGFGILGRRPPRLTPWKEGAEFPYPRKRFRLLVACGNPWGAIF